MRSLLARWQAPLRRRAPESRFSKERALRLVPGLHADERDFRHPRRHHALSSPLFVSDLDGTLLDRSARLSEYSREQLGRLLRSGMQCTVASASSIHTIASIPEKGNLRVGGLTSSRPAAPDRATGLPRPATHRSSCLCSPADVLVTRCLLRFQHEAFPPRPDFVRKFVRLLKAHLEPELFDGVAE